MESWASRHSLSFRLLTLACLATLEGTVLADEQVPVRSIQLQFPARQIAVSRDGKWLATIHGLWSCESGEQVSQFDQGLESNDSNLNYSWVCFSPDGLSLAIHRYTELVLLEIETNEVLWTVSLGEAQQARRDRPRVIFSPDGKHLIAARNDDGLVRIIDVDSGSETACFPFETELGGQQGASIRSMEVSVDGKSLVIHSSTRGNLGGPSQFELPSGTLQKRYSVSSVEAWVTTSAVVSQGKAIIYPRLSEVLLLDLASGETRSLASLPNFRPYEVIGSPTGNLVAVQFKDLESELETIRCWDFETNELRLELKDRSERPVCFVQDSELVTATESGLISFWSLSVEHR